MARASTAPILLCALLFGACATPSTRLASATLSNPPTQYLDGSAPRVDLLARKLLVGPEQPPSNFAYYCYLVFADRSGASSKARYGAAAAYLRLLTDVAEVGDHVKPENMAVLFAPIASPGAAAEILERKDVERFLAGYDYDRARLLANLLERSGHKMPRVAIVGYRVPLESVEQVDPRQVSLVRLDVDDGAVSEQRLLKLRDALESGKTEVQVAGEPAVLAKLRAFFTMVGTTLDVLDKVAPT